ncbi:type II toxin-antitoxin system RelE/ParE family toxin [Sulfurimonas denitrificans]|uniref:type II toxin-antitoxin system RelE/ParE family toxin n=1 Tax=Sulfurimonas denitrificans TaxID=39766 RepID=UPI0005A0D3D9|nr:type II toxin-antitoxin system RelE/ParE family toxin [Sulfurimonas denitrificans]
MKIVYSKESYEQLQNIKKFISLDNKKTAIQYLSKIKNKIEILVTYPYIGKINATMNMHHIRDYVVLGYKVIYKINKENITILAIYKYIDFNERDIFHDDES